MESDKRGDLATTFYVILTEKKEEDMFSQKLENGLPKTLLPNYEAVNKLMLDLLAPE